MRYSFLILLCSTLCYAAADLELQSLKPLVSDDGKTVEVQFVVLNHGPDDAAGIGLRLYLVSNGKLLSSSEYEVEPVAHDTERAGSAQLNLAAPVSSIRAEVYDLQQPDTRPSNNVQEAVLRMPGGSEADLEIEEASIVSAQPVEGRNLILRVHLVNHGPEMIANSRAVAELMLFRKTVSDTVKRPGKLAANEEQDLQLVIPIPNYVPATEGVVAIRWMPADDTVQDVSPGNNTYSLAVALVAKQPDLVLLDTQIDTRGQLQFTVKNKGNAPAAASTTAMYVNGALVKRFKTPELAAGGERRHQYGGTKILSGTQITIVADFNADVAEASEENNRYQFVSK